MYFVARNRNQRSIYKIKGMKISSSLDSGAAIAHYELYLADEYVSKGHLYATSGSGITDYRGNQYTPPTATEIYTQELTSGGVITVVPVVGKHYTGIVFNNYNEYFAGRWDPTTGVAIEVDPSSSITDPDVLIQPWIAEDKISTTTSGALLSRAWLNNTGEKIVRLWTESLGSGISVGGYRMIKIDGVDNSSNALTAPLDPTKLDPTTPRIVDLTYEKIVSIDKTVLGGTGTEDYRITYIEEVGVTSSGSSIIIHTDILKNMIVEKLK
jgi:hypothetical protein